MSPVVLSLSQVEVTLGLLGDEDFSETMSKERYIVAKKALLAARQLRAAAGEVGREGSQTRQGMVVSFLKHALSLFLARLEIHVSDVKISLVDSDGTHICSLCIEKICTRKEDVSSSLDSATERGDEEGTRAATPTGCDLDIGGAEDVEWKSKVHAQVASLQSAGSKKHVSIKSISLQWGDQPGDGGTVSEICNANVNVSVLYDIKSSPSRILINATCDDLKINLERERHILRLQSILEDMQWMSVRLKYAHLKPRQFDAKAMWLFAVNAVMLRKNGLAKFSYWKSEKDLLHSRRKYILLYRKKLERESSLMYDKKEPRADRKLLSDTGERQIQVLEDILSVSDILACQTTAKRSLEKQFANRELTHEGRAESEMMKRHVLVDGPSPAGSSGTPSLWLKIPTLADLEEMFSEVDFRPADVAQHEQHVRIFDLVTFFQMTVPQMTVCLRSSAEISDFEVRIKGIVGISARGCDIETVDVFTAKECVLLREGGILASCQPQKPKSSDSSAQYCIQVLLDGQKNNMSMTLGDIAASFTSDQDLKIFQFIPAPSNDSYESAYMQTASDLGKYGFCAVRTDKLHSMGEGVTISLQSGSVTCSIRDIEILIDRISSTSHNEAQNFGEIRHIYHLLEVMASKTTLSSRIDSLQSALTSVEEKLIYKTLKTEISGIHVSLQRQVILDKKSILIDSKVNRLQIDPDKPSLVNNISLGSISPRLSSALLNQILNFSSVVQECDSGSTGESPHTDTTIDWEGICCNLFDDHMVNILSIDCSKGSVRILSSPHGSKLLSRCQRVRALRNSDIQNRQSVFLGQIVPYITDEISCKSLLLKKEGTFATGTDATSLELQDPLVYGSQEQGNYIRR